jgi:hypothetical protein
VGDQWSEALERRTLLSVAFQFDYSLDSAGFFTDAARRGALEAAAKSITSRLSDSLTGITPTGSNAWLLAGYHPETGGVYQIDNVTVPVDRIIVYVGSRDLPGTTLAVSGPNGWSATGDPAWYDTVHKRGQDDPSTDFAPASGTIAFDNGTNWFFGETTVGLTTDQFDFYSVAAHELGHVLGVAASDAWWNQTAERTFNGPKSVAAYGAPVPLDDERSHWENGLLFKGNETSLDPTIATGRRKEYTGLDFAGLDDIGWSVTEAPPAPQPQPTVGSIASVSLIDAKTDKVVATLADQQTISQATFPGGLTLRADTTGRIGSVLFAVDGKVVRVEGYAPYTIAGDAGTDFYAWDVAPGTHTLTVAPFAGPNATGEAGAVRTITFTINPPPASTGISATQRINATSKPITVADGRIFTAAEGFIGGTESTGAADYADTIDDALFYTRRYGRDFAFNRAVPNGNYTVQLYFVDPVYSAKGGRVFDVLAEGVTALANFDIVAAGGAKRGIVVNVPVTVVDGQLSLRFLAKRDNAIISAIGIAPRIEAESATRVGAQPSTQWAGYTGAGYVDYGAAKGEYLEFNATSASAGKYRLVIRYANGGTSDRPLELRVNGTVVTPTLSFKSTGGWSTWATTEIIVDLLAGDNAIRLTSIGASGANVDSLLVA